MRPRFEIGVALDREDVLARMEQRLAGPDRPWEVALLNEQIEVSPTADELHFWSPYLKVRLVTAESGSAEGRKTVMQGRFGPNINLWTFLLAIYAICALMGATGLLVAFSQWQLDQSMIGLWITGACAVIAALVWTAAQLGQRWAQEQMRGIHDFIVATYDDVLVVDHSEAV